MSTNMSNQKINPARAEDGTTTMSLPQRSERYFKLADDWYFTTRENVTMGPFESLQQAQTAVWDFVDFIKVAPPKIVEVFKGC